MSVFRHAVVLEISAVIEAPLAGRHAPNQEVNGKLMPSHGSSITNNKPPFTCFASLCVVPDGLLAFPAVSQSLDETIQWLSLELSLIDEITKNSRSRKTSHM